MTLELKNLSVCYEKGTAMQVNALKDVNIKINENEFIGIIGHTGSGKSTLIQSMNALIKPTSGQILFNNEDIYQKKYDRRQIHKKVGLVFQYPENQLFDNDVLSDVCFGPINLGYSRQEAEKMAKEALSMLHIPATYYQKSPFELSGGEKRRVAIAGVIAMNPEIFILDEPTAGLDPYSRDNLLDCLRKLHDLQKKTIIIVSHSMEEVANYVDRIIVMNKGTVVFDDEKKNVFSQYKKLEKIGLAAPEITYILNEVIKVGISVDTKVLTLDEAAMQIIRGLKHA